MIPSHWLSEKYLQFFTPPLLNALSLLIQWLLGCRGHLHTRIFVPLVSDSCENRFQQEDANKVLDGIWLIEGSYYTEAKNIKSGKPHW